MANYLVITGSSRNYRQYSIIGPQGGLVITIMEGAEEVVLSVISSEGCSILTVIKSEIPIGHGYLISSFSMFFPTNSKTVLQSYAQISMALIAIKLYKNLRKLQDQCHKKGGTPIWVIIESEGPPIAQTHTSWLIMSPP